MDGEAQSKLYERVEEADSALALHEGARKTAQWAAANFELGAALTALAASEDDRNAFDHYKKAIETFEASLTFYSQNNKYKSEYQEAALSLARTIGAYAQRESGNDSRFALVRAQKSLLQLIEQKNSPHDAFDKAVICVELGKLYRIAADLATNQSRYDALKDAINILKKAAQIFQTKEKFENWAEAVLGEAIAWREISTLNIEDPLQALLHSVEMLKTVLSYYTPENHPLEWFYGHFEYGRAFFRIAMLNEDSQRHNAASAAVDAMRIALQTAGNDISPQLILRLRIELALALSTFAQSCRPQEAIKHTKETVTIYQDLIKQFKQNDDLYGSAVMQVNLGKELQTLATLYKGANNEKKCLSFYQEAIAVLRNSTNAQLERNHSNQLLSNQIELAKTLYNYGNHLNFNERNKIHLEATNLYRHVLKKLANDRSLSTWQLKIELSLALSHYVHSSDPDNAGTILKETIAFYKQTLEHHKDAGDTFGPFVIETTLGKDLLALSNIIGGKDGQNCRFQAIDVLRQCLSPILKTNHQNQWLSVLLDLGMSFYTAANNDETSKRFTLYEEAIEIFKQALVQVDNNEAPELIAKIQNYIALSLANIGENDQSEKGLQRLKEAELAFRLALQSAEKRESEIELMRLESNIANLFYTLARRSSGEEAKSYIHYAAQMIKKAISRIKKDILPDEWLTSQSNYGLILKHMVEYGYSDNIEQDFSQAITAFEEALAASSIINAQVEYIVHLQNLVATLLKWSEHSEGETQLAIMQRAYPLLEEIANWAEQHNQSEIYDEAQKSRDHLATLIKKNKPKTFLKRLLPFMT